MDLQLAAYAAGKRGYVEQRFGPNPIPDRRPVVQTAKMSRAFDEMAKRMRHDAYKRQEIMGKQLGLLLDRERFAQNQTWQAEYDRLKSTAAAPGLQPFVDARTEQLKALLTRSAPPTVVQTGTATPRPAEPPGMRAQRLLRYELGLDS